MIRKLKKTEIVLGVNFQSGNFNHSKETREYFELGIAKSVHNYSYHGPASIGLYVSEEVYFGEKNIYGTKFGIYTHYFFDIGFSTTYYTDFRNVNLKLRPEIGIGLGALRIVGGYNIPTFGNRKFEELTKSNGQMVIQFFLPIRIKDVTKSDNNVFKDILKT